MRRGTWPACKKQTAFLLRLANFPGGRRSALVKIGALRQRRLPVSSTGRGRRRCPCSASLHLPQAALRLRSHPPIEAPPWLRHRPHTGALNHRLLLLVAGCLQPQSLSLTESAQPPGRGAVKNSEPRQGRGRRPGQTQRPRPVDEAGSCVWRSGLNMQASSLMRRIFRAPQEERRPNMQAGRVPRRIFGQRQPGAALQFSQGRSAARRENWLSARGFKRVEGGFR